MKKILTLIMVSAICLSLTGCGCSKKEDKGNNVVTEENGEKVNKSEELNKDKTFYGFKISGISLKTEQESNILLATIENVSDKNSEQGVYSIVFIDKDGKDKYKVSVFIKSLSPGETLEVKSSITLDVIDSYDFKLEKA